MSTPLQVVERALVNHGCKGKGSSWQCPGHEDERPSLSVTEGDDGRVLLKCWAGCPAEIVVAALGLTMSDLFSLREESHIEAVYQYRDEKGAILFEKVRFRPKSFSQRRPDGNGGYIWKIAGVRPVPYRLPEMLTAVTHDETVFLVEGEKGADALASAGLAATTTGGAKSWRQKLAPFFKGARVIIVPDNDEAGHEYALLAGRDLVETAAEVRVLELPGLPDSGDPYDFVATGGTVEQLDDMSAEAPTFTDWAKTKEEKGGSGDAKTPPHEEKRVVRLSLVDVIRGIKRRNPFPLGLPHLDAMLGGGLSAGDSLVVGGGPGTIKTTTLATVIKSLAGPKTAIYGVFFDEHYERVCRRIAVRFGLKYVETEEPAEEVIERLQRELARCEAMFEAITPVTDPTIEQIVEDCLAATPQARVPIFILDHLHRLRSTATTDRDQPSAAVGKVVNAVLRATTRGAIVYALSEVTKAALNPEVVRANPLAVFADSRAIASRFDVSLATVRIPPPPGTDEILAEVIGTGKNRFGTGYAKYVSALNLATWEITTRDADDFETEAEERKAAAKGKEHADRMRQDDELVLAYIVRHAVSQEIGCKARDVEEGLSAESGGAVSQKRARAALVRLREKRVEEHEWKAAGKRGPEAKYVRILPEENVG